MVQNWIVDQSLRYVQWLWSRCKLQCWTSQERHFLCQSISNCLEYLVSITLAIGMGISMVLLLMEHFYMRYLQTHVQKTTDNGCCALISQVCTGRLISDHIFFQSFSPTFLLFLKSIGTVDIKNLKAPKINYQNFNGQKKCCALITQ